MHIPVGLCALNAGLILGIMATPTVCSIAEDALSYVPRSFREASFAKGAAVIPKSFFDPVRPMTAAIAAEMGEAPMGGDHYQAASSSGCASRAAWQ